MKDKFLSIKKSSSSDKTHQTGIDLADPLVLSQVLMDVAQRAQPLMAEFMEKYEFNPEELLKDPMNLRPAYMNFMNQLLSDPQKLADMQMKFWTDWTHLFQESSKRFISGEGTDIYKPEPGDRRFKAPEWQDSPLFDFIKQSYLLTSKWTQDVVHQTTGLDNDTRARIEFQTKQFLNAMAPSNFLLTNPEVIKETLDSKGENLVRGLQNMLEDMKRGGGTLDISTTDYSAFTLGENIAVTPGKVMFQNDLMQLIQYTPTTEKVFKRPLLIVPPWINKYYILDLKPKNSLIKWLVDQGHTVFTISWVNPNRELAAKTFENYMEEGLLEALTQVKNITGENDCNMMGYCLGGTLLAVTLAYLAANKQDNRVASATFLTTMVDFDKSGEMKLFMDEAQLTLLDQEMKEKGFLPAEHLKKTFSLLRANDMIWSFVINNYLMGKEPFPFDLLYWNDDATNMPAAMHSFYLRKFYHENRLTEAGGVSMKDTPIDMHKVTTPAYFMSTKEDHIAPWKATYATTQMFKGPKHFTLAASGHVAGVVNPPEAKKYCFWTANDYPAKPEEWLSHTKEHEGSWWPHWGKWIADYTGPQITARKPGEGKLKPIEDAPGSYVKMKSEE